MKIMFLSFFICFLMTSCRNENKQPPVVSETQMQEEFIKANQDLVKEEALQIEEFIKRHNFVMTKTGSGLRYQIYKTGLGKFFHNNELVSIAYSCFMIDGTLLYQADSSKPLTFMLGKAQQPRGLEEGLLMMPEGSRARLVIPAHLAYGLTGDDNKIPGAATLYYDVTLLKINHEEK